MFTDEAQQPIRDGPRAKHKTGARALRTIVEEVLLDAMYEIPSRQDVNKCVVTKETIEKHLDPTLVTEGGQELDVTDELREESA